jgi:hypothetical protein
MVLQGHIFKEEILTITLLSSGLAPPSAGTPDEQMRSQANKIKNVTDDKTTFLEIYSTT